MSERKHGVYLHWGQSAIPSEVDTLPLVVPLPLVDTLPPVVGGVTPLPHWVVGANSLPPEIDPLQGVVDHLSPAIGGVTPLRGSVVLVSHQ